MNPQTTNRSGLAVSCALAMAICANVTANQPAKNLSVDGHAFRDLNKNGRLDLKGRDLARIRQVMKTKPTVVCVYIERAAVVPELAEGAGALLASFGSSDAAVMDVIFGKFRPVGMLPIELPRSMEAVKGQKEDVPFDSENPLFEFGFGLTY